MSLAGFGSHLRGAQEARDFFLPGEAPDELIEMQRRGDRGQDSAIGCNQLQIRGERHGICHGEDALGNFHPIPRKPRLAAL